MPKKDKKEDRKDRFIETKIIFHGKSKDKKKKGK